MRCRVKLWRRRRHRRVEGREEGRHLRRVGRGRKQLQRLGHAAARDGPSELVRNKSLGHSSRFCGRREAGGSAREAGAASAMPPAELRTTLGYQDYDDHAKQFIVGG